MRPSFSPSPSSSFLLGTLALLLAACPDPPASGDGEGGSCIVDDDCNAGLLCVEGACGLPTTTCQSDDECRDDQHCDVVCTDNGSCRTDDDCPWAEVCEDGACTRIGTCATDDDCPVTAHCEDGVCHRNDACAGDADCNDQQRCEGAVCVDRDPCNTAFDCDDAEHCVDELCRPLGDCDVDTDCPALASCQAGTCTQNGACTDDDDCEPTESCTDGACLRNDTCQSDVDCPADQACLTGVCTQRLPCLSDEDCSPQETCVDGTCALRGFCDDTADCGPGESCLDDRCTATPCVVDADCDDALFCNGLETCNPRVGCAAGVAPATAGLPTCADEICDEATDSLVVTAVNSRCGDANLCTSDVCDVAVGCVNASDDSVVPPQGTTTDCTVQACRGGAIVSLPANDEVPPQGSPTDCVRNVCQGGVSVPVPANTEVPPQVSTTDCLRQACNNGVVIHVPEPETLTQLSPNDCVRQSCVNGTAQNVPNDLETPSQVSGTDCLSQTCSGGAVVNVPNNNETPPQASATDCRRQTCVGGVVQSVANDDENPVPDGNACRDGDCQGGVATFVPNSGRCADAIGCTDGTCNVDGTCSQTPNDSLCDCAGDAVGFCRPGQPGTSGGCLCLTPATLTCATSPTRARVLTAFNLSATASGAQAGSTFRWDLVGVPPGADPAAQLLVNATTAAARFTPTTPSVPGQRDYRLRVTLQEPSLPPQTCDVTLEAERVPDTLQVSLSLVNSVGLDVDLHLIGGPDSSTFDFPFHDLHDPILFGDDPDNSCHYANCPVCTVTIPGQGCIATNPRVVDFDGDGAALTDRQDPQLDIDNRRGCFTGTNGDLTCIPERITVEEPAAGDYRVFPYLFGNALAVTPGLLTTPAQVQVRIDVECRGVTRSYTRTLFSTVSATDGAAADTNSPRRYGDVPVQFSIPASGACTLPVQ